jgi:hypothetical protein
MAKKIVAAVQQLLGRARICKVKAGTCAVNQWVVGMGGTGVRRSERRPAPLVIFRAGVLRDGAEGVASRLHGGVIW